MTSPHVPTCKSCGASFTWGAVAATGRQMPIDREPHAEGAVRFDANRWNVTVLSGRPLEAARAEGTPLHRSHFATCSGAASHRNPRATTERKP